MDGKYRMGSPSGYCLEKWLLINRDIKEISIYDLKERCFVFLDEKLSFYDSIRKATRALTDVQLDR